MDKKYTIEASSGVHSGNCTLGEGNTPEEAWLDALGPKPWSPQVKKMAKNLYWVNEVEDEG